MRLIDADALKKDIARLHILNDEAEIRKAYASNPYSTLSDFEDTLVSVFDDIDEAPTIDAVSVVHGEWIKSETDGFICSACGSGYRNQPTCMGKPMFEYCPICGAKMDGERIDT